MSNNFTDNYRDNFEKLSTAIFNSARSDERIILSAQGEESHFVRFNHSRVRQSGVVNDAALNLRLIKNERVIDSEFNFTGDYDFDLNRLNSELNALRHAVSDLPPDPFLVEPASGETVREIHPGETLAPDEAISELMPPLGSDDFSGIYASGPLFRANANSNGFLAWFENNTYSFDYSLSTPADRMVKGTLAGNSWRSDEYRSELSKAKEQLAALKKPGRTIKPGEYRTYFAPAAVADFIGMFAWGALSEAALRQGQSPLLKLRDGTHSFSDKFSLAEDFSQGSVPRFNSNGEVAPVHLDLIQNGNLANTLVSSRTANEYKLESNFAAGSESPRAPVIAAGKLTEEQVLSKLGTGLYISNLHYLNWSDRQGGRITGMTRYACFWVENGELVEPIETMRFDDTIFNLFGQSLIDFTARQSWIPEIDTYVCRKPGGVSVPGMLVEKFKLTL